MSFQGLGHPINEYTIQNSKCGRIEQLLNITTPISANEHSTYTSMFEYDPIPESTREIGNSQFFLDTFDPVEHWFTQQTFGVPILEEIEQEMSKSLVKTRDDIYYLLNSYSFHPDIVDIKTCFMGINDLAPNATHIKKDEDNDRVYYTFIYQNNNTTVFNFDKKIGVFGWTAIALFNLPVWNRIGGGHLQYCDLKASFEKTLNSLQNMEHPFLRYSRFVRLSDDVVVNYDASSDKGLFDFLKSLKAKIDAYTSDTLLNWKSTKESVGYMYITRHYPRKFQTSHRISIKCECINVFQVELYDENEKLRYGRDTFSNEYLPLIKILILIFNTSQYFEIFKENEIPPDEIFKRYQSATNLIMV